MQCNVHKKKGRCFRQHNLQEVGAGYWRTPAAFPLQFWNETIAPRYQDSGAREPSGQALLGLSLRKKAGLDHIPGLDPPGSTFLLAEYLLFRSCPSELVDGLQKAINCTEHWLTPWKCQL